MAEGVKYVLDETRLPRHWYNLTADLPTPPPPVLHPGTLEPVGPDDLAPLFPKVPSDRGPRRLRNVPGVVTHEPRQPQPTHEDSRHTEDAAGDD